MKKPTFTCGLDAALVVLGGKWKPLILYHLAHGTRRYGELRRAIGGVSDKVLIQQLKELQADGIIARLDYGEIPPKVEYSRTAFGKTLGKALAPLRVGNQIFEGCRSNHGTPQSARASASGIDARMSAAMSGIPGCRSVHPGYLCWIPRRSLSSGSPKARPGGEV
jgi:DNA-binding HxlR family transcriptional regulator